MTGAQATHAVENQPPEFAPRDLWRDDAALREFLAEQPQHRLVAVAARAVREHEIRSHVTVGVVNREPGHPPSLRAS